MRAASGEEPRRGGREHKFEHLATLAAHVQPPAPVVNLGDNGCLEVPAEVRHARVGAHAGHWARGAER